jgi:hypothetical protein
MVTNHVRNTDAEFLAAIVLQGIEKLFEDVSVRSMELDAIWKLQAREIIRIKRYWSWS